MNDATQIYFPVCEDLECLGCKRSFLDYGVLTWHNENNELCRIFQSQVDDFLWAGNDKFKCNIVEKLCKKFILGNIHFKISDILA